MRYEETRDDVNYKLYTCDSCHELWLVPESILPTLWCTQHSGVVGVVRELCVLHRLRKGHIGLFDKCSNCESRFLCVSSVPKVWA